MTMNECLLRCIIERSGSKVKWEKELHPLSRCLRYVAKRLKRKLKREQGTEKQVSNDKRSTGLTDRDFRSIYYFEN